MEVSVKPVKEKRRNSEKRKEKSRDAARWRRSRESEIFSNLSEVLPLPGSVTSHLDKASIMRLVIAHLRIRDLIKKMSITKDEEDMVNPYDSFYLKALGGIILVLSLDGEIVYASTNLPVYLGVTQTDLLGQSIYDVSHPCDHSEIRDLLSGKMVARGQISSFIRMKCTLTSKGRNLNMKSASYKVLHMTGNFICANGEDKENLRFVCIAHPIPHPVDIEAPLGTYTFLSKHSLDMKFTYADDRMKDFLGYNPDSLIGKSLYNYHHAQDNKGIETSFKSLFAKGQSETGQYRFLAQGGGFAWVSTQATLIYCEKGNKPLSVVCVNYVVSEKLNDVEIYSLEQLEWKRKSQQKEEMREKENIAPKVLVELVNSAPVQPRPEPATVKVFVKKTDNMNAKFLMFPSDEDSGYTVLKDEPGVDLTHLAPTAGPVCVPLDTTPLAESFLLPPASPGPQACQPPVSSSYCPLIDEEKDTPLFSSYRDDCSTGSLSPPLTQSPGGNSLPSLCGLEEDPGFESMKSLLGIDISVEGPLAGSSEELSSRAPYIPMGEMDDLPLLMPSDFIWNLHYTLSPNSNDSSARCSPSPMEMKSVEDFSSLAHLLQVDKEDTLNKYPDQGGGCSLRVIPASSSNLPSMDSERRKRVSTLGQDTAKKRKSSKSCPVEEELSSLEGGNSVLKNLLVEGRDLTAGYVCSNPRQTQLSRFNKRVA